MIRTVGARVVLLFLFSSMLSAQTSRFSFSANVTGNFSVESEGNGTSQTPSNSLGLLGTFTYSLTRKSAFALNYGVTRNSQYFVTNNSATGALEYFAVQTNINEITANYAYTPWSSRRFSPYLLLGGGVLLFNPTGASYGSNSAVDQKLGAALYGVGTDVRITRKLGLRVQYRGLFYKAPDFSVPGLDTGSAGHLAEPSIGLVYHFH
jgi:outer membrane protein W